MQSYSYGQVLIASPLLALPLFVVPAFCSAVNRSSFVWSLLAVGYTGWRLYRARRSTTASLIPVKGVIPQLVLATVLVQMLAFAWIGAVWMLQGAGHLVMLSRFASRIVGWIQSHWFADVTAWLVLFAVVCGLFRLARPILAWHRRTIVSAAQELSS